MAAPKKGAYPGIKEPTIEPVSLRDSVMAIKETTEILTRQRGDPLNAAVTWSDLVSLGLIPASRVPKKNT